jgi:hypothetical protein
MAWSIWHSVRSAWSVVTGRGRLPSDPFRGVFLHDPEAGKPKNLDDPFHDNKVQERVADAIARATRPSRPGEPHRD